MKFRKVVFLLMPLIMLTSCQKNDAYVTQHYLSFKYKLEDCADIHGQDNYKNIWFSDYHGTSYTYLFDLSQSYLDMRVVIIDGRANGIGDLKLTRKDDETKSTSVVFKYYCSLRDNTGGDVSSTLDDNFSNFVFCIYWCRVNLKYVNPADDTEFTLTLHFRGGTPNEYPSEFDN